jgi:DNA-directed RNA polymerase
MQVLASKAQTHIALLSGSDLEREIKLESGYRSDGIATYLKMRARAEEQGDGALLKPAERMIQHWFGPVEHLVKAKVRESKDGYFQGAAIVAATLRLLPPDVMTALVMRDIVGLLLQGKHSYGVSLPVASYAVGRAVMAEYNLKQIKAEDPDAARILTQHIRRLDPRKIQWWAKKTLEDPKVDRSACIHTGAALIKCLIDGAACGDYDSEVFQAAFSIQWRHRGKIKSKILVMSRECKRIIEDGHTVRKLLRPRFGPMIVQPFPWSPQNEGGYATLRTPLISFISKRHKEAIAAGDMTRVYDALNALGSTAWRNNSRVLAVARQIWAEGGNRLDLPPMHDRPLPPFPPGFNPNGANAAERWSGCADGTRQAWKSQACDIHTANHKMASSRTEWICKLDMAERFEHERRYWFPHQLDFRGRAYPIPLFLNHQGDDVCRGLLEFADPVPLGNDGLRRLMIHAANCYGIDKIPYASREEWTRQHARDIAMCAVDPMGCEFWHHADKPWQFLAACYALDDPEAAQHLPTQWDGSCNGLQHYAAMTLDATGGALVNLIPGDTPSDVYSVVCELVRAGVEKDIRGGHKYAQIVLPMVVRQVVKQPVMTQTYGVTMVGAKKQILNQLRELGLEGDDLYKCSQYLANKVMGSIANLCPGATGAMDWLRAYARAFTDAGRLVQWTTPMGLPVVQSYSRRGQARIMTSLGEIWVRKLEDAPPKAGKQIQSFPPNFVHSIDACHMMETAVACRSSGIEFAGVHDSYWTHAGTADQMNVILRDEFVRLHSLDVLGLLYEQFSDGIEPPPAKGTLDLSLAAKSPYLFH